MARTVQDMPHRVGLGPACCFMTMLLLVLAVLMSNGQPAAATSPPFQIAPGDTLQVTVFGQPELSGTFSVDGANTISLPLIGSIDVRDMTAAEVERRITEAFADGYLHDPKVNVRISEMRPVFILGNVKTPGSYPYRNGFAVINVVAIAGGYTDFREEANVVFELEVLQARERLTLLERGLVDALARQARLMAQRDGLDEIKFPEELENAKNVSAVAAVMQGETNLFKAQKETLENQKKILKEQVTQIREELQALEAQIQSEVRQLALVNDQMKDIEGLVRNGLARKAQLLELQREVARVEGARAQHLARSAQVRQNLFEAELKTDALQGEFTREMLNGLQETRGQIADLRTNIHAATMIRDTRIYQAGIDPMAAVEDRITISRYTDGKLTTFDAAEETLIWPGDIVNVQRRNPAFSVSTAGGAQRATLPDGGMIVRTRGGTIAPR